MGTKRTARRQSEKTGKNRTRLPAIAAPLEDFRNLSENSPDIIDRFDRHFRHLYVNPAGARLLGMEAWQIIGKTNRETGVPEPYCSLWEARIRKIFETGKPVDLRDTFPSAGGVGYFESRCVPEFGPDGKVRSVLVVTRDVTAYKVLQRELEEARDDLERKVKDRTVKLQTLAAEIIRAEHRERLRIAHVLHEELQQWLAAAKFRVGELRDQRLPSPALTIADQVQQMLERAIEVTRSLTVDLRPPVVHEQGLRMAMRWLASDMRHKFDLSVKIIGERISGRVAEGIGMFVFDAIRELLLNVVKHSGVRSATIRFAADTRTRFRVEVIDHGCGFDPSRSDSNKFGLFTIRERADVLGGSLAIVSNPGEGTSVRLTLPFELSASPARQA